MSESTILIVDDVDNNRVALSMRLELVGYSNFVEAVNGREALNILRSQKIDLVLLDIMMPEMDGYQVLEELKVDTSLRDIPVIMISAVDEMESVIRCIELGAVDYLQKPFNPTLLKARVDTFMERAKFKDQERAYIKQLEAERKKSDELLGNLLPRQIARILKANQKIPPVNYDDVSVLFMDIVGFTAYSESNPPDLVFTQLETLISELEELVERHGLTKIKTIGDAFMATAGLMDYHDDPVGSAVRCGLEMVKIAEAQTAGWKVRVGIDHGPVIAGIIGRTNFQYDVWGDTVNTASRIEAIGQPGSVTVSGRAWQRLHGRGQGRSLGMMDLKGKTSLEIIECHALEA